MKWRAVVIPFARSGSHAVDADTMSKELTKALNELEIEGRSISMPVTIGSVGVALLGYKPERKKAVTDDEMIVLSSEVTARILQQLCSMPQHDRSILEKEVSRVAEGLDVETMRMVEEDCRKIEGSRNCADPTLMRAIALLREALSNNLRMSLQ